MNPEMEDVVRRVEEENGFSFDESEVEFAEAQSRKKMELTGKTDDYFILIFRTELDDIIMRREINALNFAK